VGQANFAHNQQINNQAEPSRTRENKKSPNELMEKTDGEWLDRGTPREAVRVDPELETGGQTVQGQEQAQERLSRHRMRLRVGLGHCSD